MASGSDRQAGAAALPSEYSQDWPVPWTPVWGTRDGLLPRLETALARGALGLLSRLPEGLLAPVIGGLARLARRLDRRHARAAREFITTALGEMPRAELDDRVLQAYRHFLRLTVETVQMSRMTTEELRRCIEFVISDDARRVIEGEGGCVIISGHIGNWEVSVAAAPMSGLDPLYAVAKPASNRSLSKLVQRDREKLGVRLLPRKGAMAAAPTVIRSGGTLGLLLDHRARVKPMLAPFFGRPARCDRSAAVLIRRLRAPILVCACYRTEEPFRFRMEYPEVLWPEDLAGASPEQITTRVNQALERVILKAPEQYFWLHDRYKDTPSEMPSARNPAQE